jgi:Purple acid Phosphatase, N-terminal domain
MLSGNAKTKCLSSPARPPSKTPDASGQAGATYRGRGQPRLLILIMCRVILRSEHVKMNRVLLILAISVLSGSMLAQESPTTPKPVRVRIIQGPKVELAREHLTVINWTTNNPGGSPVHYGIVQYGTDPNSLIETAKSPIRLNPDHSSTLFRVRLDSLKPQTTYYYTVDSIEATGSSDGPKSRVHHFTTP